MLHAILATPLAIGRRAALAFAGIALAAGSPLAAQMETIDPDTAIDGDLMEQPGEPSAYEYADPTPATTQQQTYDFTPDPAPGAPVQPVPSPSVSTDVAPATAAVAPSWSDPVAAEQGVEETAQAYSTTYGEDDLIGAAEGVFGKGAEGVARMIQKLLAEQGEPNAYIVGREASGAFILGARYGSGRLYHKVEGERPVYWTGPSIGFDAGANAGNTFVLVYNLYDSEELYERYPAGEGQAYVLGGLHASYLRKGDVVMIPVRVGAGLRLGINAGYMKFSKKQRWLPF